MQSRETHKRMRLSTALCLHLQPLKVRDVVNRRQLILVTDQFHTQLSLSNDMQGEYFNESKHELFTSSNSCKLPKNPWLSSHMGKLPSS